MMSSLTADKAGRLQDFFFLLFFAPQIGEGVDDDAEDEVEDDDDDHEEEQQVVDHPGCEQRLLGKEEDTCMLILQERKMSASCCQKLDQRNAWFIWFERLMS